MSDWRSYNDVAETYERVHAPRFAVPARDLVALAAPGPGARVLDIGTGTGIAAEIATTAVGEDGFVVGIDESLGMLSIGRRTRPSLDLTAARVIDLPFPDATFDTVLGNFVIAHFTKYETALFDITRVLRSGGRLAVTAWADGEDELTKTWLELVESVVPREMLEPARDQAAPWHERFRHRTSMEETLIDAGLRHVRTDLRQYQFRYPLDDYVDGLSTWATGRFVRDMLGPTRWDAFRARARETFADRFPDPVNDFREVLFATAVKP